MTDRRAKPSRYLMFTLTKALLKFWDDYDRDRWVGTNVMLLVKMDSAREQKGIPSFLG